MRINHQVKVFYYPETDLLFLTFLMSGHGTPSRFCVFDLARCFRTQPVEAMKPPRKPSTQMRLEDVRLGWFGWFGSDHGPLGFEFHVTIIESGE